MAYGQVLKKYKYFPKKTELEEMVCQTIETIVSDQT